ncbi:MAG: bifunctional methylenetetrahydrofolate dehydrogenase/methenyltetrahydrofolate cyclohydrolase FolD [Gammaproteobacteria bacterium]|nr:bifunctional methylenetetrahydrofolate dehydrogenase/methenyltetrahydrofolate cyclohydrolase FolD [Gammaproteobacteria bacterium]
MSATILNGNVLAASIRADLKERVQAITSSNRRPPGLAVVLVGEDPASAIYVRLKQKDCLETGMKCQVLHLPASTLEAELADIVTEFNADPTIDGILIQLPLPEHINDLSITAKVLPRKDVDGISPHNMGMLTLRKPAHRACTPKGVMSLIAQTDVQLLGSHAVVVGASNHVGRPMGLEFLLRGCTVTTAHKFTRNTKELTREADVLVSATGKAGLIEADWVKPGAVVIDIGIMPQEDGTICGDVDFEAVKEVAGWITPVPGGVGPMTRVSILQNVVDAYNRTLK